MRILYTLLIYLYGFSIALTSLFSKKAKQWISGRRDLFEHLKPIISTRKHWIWFHAASLGEFEQGRPLIELIRDRHPAYGMLLTFFSPSGYLIRKDYKGADHVTYMPLDTAYNAKRFIALVNPKLVVFIKYEIWYHHLVALEKAGVPTFLISANLREDQIYFKPIGAFLKSRLHNLRHIFTQTETCVAMLRQRGFTNVSHAGDTRVDRVMAIAAAPKDFSWLKNCIGEQPILVAGSTWPADEARLIPAVKETGIALIIAPHEIDETRIRDLEAQLPGGRRLSQLRSHQEQTNAVIVDTIGDLAHLYAIGNLAYVGGGFGKGIHNILEPAAHGLPVIIGPQYNKFAEAVMLIEAGATRSILTVEEVASAIRYFLAPDNRPHITSTLNAYFQAQRGATEKIYERLQPLL